MKMTMSIKNEQKLIYKTSTKQVPLRMNVDNRNPKMITETPQSIVPCFVR